MIGLKLKVCGMRDPDNIREVASLRPDYMGFIFYDQSKRFVSDEKVVCLASGVERVGVFVNASEQFILEKVINLELQFAQLHGDESPQFCARLKEKGVSVIKAFSIGEEFDFAITLPYVSSCDFFLFDTKGKYYGGNGKRFDWTILKGYHQRVPFFLSGGIDLDALSYLDELDGMNLHAIDVNSGFEVYPGLKDIERLKQLTDLIKGNDGNTAI